MKNVKETELVDNILIPLRLILTDSRDSESGICYFINRHLRRMDNAKTYGSSKFLFTKTMKEACLHWEHFSGDNNYPINHPDYNGGEVGEVICVSDDGIVTYKTSDYVYDNVYSSNAEAAFEYLVYKGEYGRVDYYAGEYGRRRLELVQRMIDILELKLK